jgi:galactitol-specific phosphotransferase system IIC component
MVHDQRCFLSKGCRDILQLRDQNPTLFSLSISIVAATSGAITVAVALIVAQIRVVWFVVSDISAPRYQDFTALPHICIRVKHQSLVSTVFASTT